MMTDLEIAVQELKNHDYSLVAVKNQTVRFTGRGPGLRPLLQAAEQLKEQLAGACLADKVVGKAAALLCLHFKVSSLYTPLISLPARQFERHPGLPFQAERSVPFIRAGEGEKKCPMEELTESIDDPAQAYALIDRRINLKRQEPSCEK